MSCSVGKDNPLQKAVLITSHLDSPPGSQFLGEGCSVAFLRGEKRVPFVPSVDCTPGSRDTKYIASLNLSLWSKMSLIAFYR